MSRARIITVFGSVGLALDLAVKYAVVGAPFSFEGVFLLGGHFGIVRFINTQFAWGIPIGNTASIALMVLAIAALVAYWVRSARREQHSPLALVLAGALGNLASRVAWGGVVDYLAIPFGGMINLADVMIVIGIALLLIKKFPNSKFQSSNIE